MKNLHVTLLTATLLANSGAQLVASQATPSSLFYERQTQVTTLSGQPAISASFATATLSAIAQTQASNHTSDSSTSSATTGSAGSIGIITDTLDLERKKVRDESEYTTTWAKTLRAGQQEVAQEIRDTITDLPEELVKLIAQYSDRLKGICVATLTGHEGSITALILLPDGSLVSSSFDKTIKIWSSLQDSHGKTTWRCTQTLMGHDKGVLALIVLPDNSLVSGSCNHTIKIWSFLKDSHGQPSWKCTKTLTEHDDIIVGLIVLPNNSFASRSSDTIKIWQLTQKSRGETIWKCTQTLVERNNDIECIEDLVVLSDNSFASGLTYSIKIWQPTQDFCGQTMWKCTKILEHHYKLSCLAALPNGSLVSGSYEVAINFWNPNKTSNGQTVWKCVQSTKVNCFKIQAITPLSDDSLAFASVDDNNIQIWRSNKDPNGQIIWQWAQTIKRYAEVTDVMVRPLNDSLLIDGGNSIKIWE